MEIIESRWNKILADCMANNVVWCTLPDFSPSRNILAATIISGDIPRRLVGSLLFIIVELVDGLTLRIF